MKKVTKKLCVASLMSLIMVSDVAADENLLGYTKGAETLPQGASEGYLWITHQAGKRRGSYSAQALRAEYEYGVTDRLSTSVYLNGYRHDYECADEGCAGAITTPEITGSKKQFSISGASIEAKYMVLSPYADDVGMALYGEMTYNTVDSVTGDRGKGYEVELMLILQKAFMDGQMQWMTNIEVEGESWESKAGEGTDYAIAPRLRTGASYRFAPNWFAGIEGWGDVEYLNRAGGSWAFDHWDVFAGPSLHYGDHAWWATVTWAHQIAGSNESEDNRIGLHLADHVRNEIRVKLGYNF